MNTRDVSLKISDNVRAYAVPTFLLVLKTVPPSRIMAGSYYDPATGILNLNSVTDYGSGCSYVTKIGFDAVGSSDLGDLIIIPISILIKCSYDAVANLSYIACAVNLN